MDAGTECPPSRTAHVSISERGNEDAIRMAREQPCGSPRGTAAVDGQRPGGGAGKVLVWSADHFLVIGVGGRLGHCGLWQTRWTASGASLTLRAGVAPASEDHSPHQLPRLRHVDPHAAGC